MTARELMKILLDGPLDAEVYIGKGMGPLEKAETSVAGNTGTDRSVWVLAP